ncbi:MAG: DUF2062 domain-containing protein [Terracidiphilus sp.]
MGRIPAAAKRRAAHWLSQGMSPRRLALTLSLGFAVGCIPVVGVPTVLCAALAMALRLNLPAIQAANYAAMPVQLAMIVPFVRLGGWIVSGFNSARPVRFIAPFALPHLPALNLATRVSGMAGQALLAWMVAAIPAVVLMTAMLTGLLRRIPAVRSAEAGD